MRTKNNQIQISEFEDLVALPSKSLSYQIFDLIIEGEININSYCETLIDMVCILNNTSYSNFIDYQCLQVQNPILFLEKFQELITNNEKVFRTKCINLKMSYLFDLLDKKHKELQSTTVKKINSNITENKINAKSDERFFSFFLLKQQLVNLKNDKERIIFITKEKHEYKQANLISKSSILTAFDKLCTKEIQQINDLAVLNTISDKTIINNKIKILPIKKIKINCNLNQFIDIYFQLSHELFVDGKPFIDGSINDIVASIVNSFVDKNGNEISPETVKTILTPSRTDKRPKNHRKIDINKII